MKPQTVKAEYTEVKRKSQTLEVENVDSQSKGTAAVIQENLADFGETLEDMDFDALMTELTGSKKKVDLNVWD